jgi:HEAT repeats
MISKIIQNRFCQSLPRLAFITFLSSVSLSGFPLLHISQLHAEEEEVPGVKESIRKAVDYLSKNSASEPAGFYGIAGYALLKADVDPDERVIEIILNNIRAKYANGFYYPKSEGHGLYESAVDLMALEAADPIENKEVITAIAKFIMTNQKDHGGWYYLAKHHRDQGGDTSITQYAILGLWAADRAGVKIPRKVWNGVVKFHLNTQRSDGAFSYHPGSVRSANLNMTIGGIANLHIARRFLYPNSGELKLPETMTKSIYEKKKSIKEGDKAGEKTRPELPRRKLPGPIKELLKRETVIAQFSIEQDEEERLAEIKKEQEEKKKKEETENLKIQKSEKTASTSNSLSNIDSAIKKALDWVSINYTPKGKAHNFYFHYSIERMSALADIEEIAGKNWYQEEAKILMETQNPKGGWTAGYRASSSTSFALLFLTRSTRKLLKGGKKRSRLFGKGILAGGRGLPDNLSDVQEEKGEVKKEKMEGPLNDLLSALENPESLKVEAVQNTIIEKFQIGNREELIGQIDRLLKLLKNPRAEVRRTVLWALGRTGDMRVVPKVIEALNDNDLDVVVEARNALCWISHRPNGFGMTAHPLEGHEDVQDDAQKETLIKEWKENSFEKWTKWYRKVRPYQERDDLEENSDPIKSE